MQSIETKVINRIYGHGRGWCFTQDVFLDLGSSVTIRSALLRLQKSNIIRRIARGLYEYPRNHKDLGIISPDINRVAQAIAKKYSLKIQPTGAYAANLLGLSTQVPAKVMFLTDGKTRKVKVGKTEITFKKTTPKNMTLAGTNAGLFINGLKYMGEAHITEQIARRAWLKLNEEDKKLLIKKISVAPIWVQKLIRAMED